MRNKYTGPYQITSISSNGQYYFKDKYSQQLKRPVPANQVVCYYGVGGFCRPKQEIDVENCQNHSSDDNGDVSDSPSIPDDISAAGSDSENIEEDISAAASDSESVLNANGTVSDSQIVQDETGGVASERVLVLYLTLRV